MAAARRVRASATAQGPRINLVTAVRRTLEHELAVNPRVVVFGEDVGRKGGVHAATLGLQEKFGVERVFDTSLSEEGIIGRAVGMAAAGLMPVPEIQFRKYADPAAEQLNDCGTMRWRTANRFAAPMVVRIPGGFFKCGDPWHSQSNEVQWIHGIGLARRHAVECRRMRSGCCARRCAATIRRYSSSIDRCSTAAERGAPIRATISWCQFGKATLLAAAAMPLTVVTWGAMVERCELALERTEVSADLLDLRTLSPWDREATLASVRKTRRCLIVHEDTMTAGFGAEIAAVLAKEAFFDLDAPIERLAMPDVPSPHSPVLLEAVLPSVDAHRRDHLPAWLRSDRDEPHIDVVAPRTRRAPRPRSSAGARRRARRFARTSRCSSSRPTRSRSKFASPASGELAEILKQPNEEVQPGQTPRAREVATADGASRRLAAAADAGGRARRRPRGQRETERGLRARRTTGGGC